ncbi:MAG: DUF1461 domain-containing protein [Oleispira sp.]
MNKILLNGRVFALLLLALVFSLYAAWMVNVQLGYGYSWLYEFYETEQHISRYAPQNKHRTGFETTSVAVHKEVFQQIVDSVHGNGVGLELISYQYQGQSIPLLHQAELIHLQDVANLINNIHYITWLCGGLFMVGLLAEYRHRRKHKSRASSLGILSVFTLLMVVITGMFLIWGAKAIFYQMHIMIFPADHQWFFYYQDSLMSTLMKAPDLFAGITVQIVLLALIFYAFLLASMQRLLKR